MKLGILGEKLLVISQRFFGIPSLPFLSGGWNPVNPVGKQPRFATTISSSLQIDLCSTGRSENSEETPAISCLDIAIFVLLYQFIIRLSSV
jgi:hypothetical protein